MILYLTSQQHTNLLDFLTEQTDALPIKKMTGNFMLKQFVIYDMRNFSHCTELVLDRDAFGDDDIHFAEAIEEFLTMYNARITVICEGLQESAPLCHDLIGFEDFFSIFIDRGLTQKIDINVINCIRVFIWYSKLINTIINRIAIYCIYYSFGI